ncbi:hypothetical protein OOU_Y34scaffold00725g28 [Pyricularia oryzae Y34]|uniref:M protein repeat protein n=1 Tax=Pyricularia oryzae (strain Y34) TaxID=1143189 RepID=A0AA97NRU9_PYRO3|nr:hypothetical protein OOU_Y34scaffold00725g28 [Pyricularia oryzae Y34]
MADDDKAKAEKLAAAKKRASDIGAGYPAPQTILQLHLTTRNNATYCNWPASGDSSKKADKPKDAPAPSASAAPEQEEDTIKDDADKDKPSDVVEQTVTSPSLSEAEQSRARSTSFRKQSISSGVAGAAPPTPGLTSPDLRETAPDIYRKNMARIEELEKENKRLARESTEAEKRWQKAEEELADLREAEGDSGKKAGGSDEVEKLKSEVASLQRQNAQLQARRHGSQSSVSHTAEPQELAEQLAARTATIETMELEMSRLRAQVERLASNTTQSEQVMALEERAARAEKAAGQAQRELADMKKNLERASEKAVREGSERASADTKVRALEKEAAEAKEKSGKEAARADALEKKVATLTTLHREQDARSQALRKDKEKAEKEVQALEVKMEALEAENLKLRKRDAQESGGTDNDGVDELEDEGRAKLEARVRELEAENHELRSGIWQEKRKEMQVGPDGQFSEVELTTPHLGAGSPSQQRKASGFGDFFSSITGSGGHHHHQHHQHHHNDEPLLEDDDDFEFDEAAFRRAQEEDAKKRIERIKEIKRGLKNWEGWRLDLVESRSVGGEGVGEIFEV